MSLSQHAPHFFEHAQPLTDIGYEAAVSRVTVIVSTSAPFTVAGRQRTAFVAGPQTKPLPVLYPDTAGCLEWSLPIFEVRQVFGIHPREICNRVVAVADLPPSENARRVNNGDPVVYAPLQPDHVSEIARVAWSRLQAGHDATLGALSKGMGIGLRRLEQVFQKALGLSPKRVQSLLRYERACHLLRVTDAPLADIALRAGYSDQSHMTRDFRLFSGLTPVTARSAFKAVP